MQNTISLLALISLTAAPVAAQDAVRVNGFGNINLIHSGSDTLGYKYDLSKEGLYNKTSFKPASSLGLQINATISDEIDVVIQGILQDRENNSFNKTISWAFLRYRITPNITIRVGRLATPIYMLSEYRHVGFAYLWTKPNNDFYSAIPMSNVDGGDISFKTPLGEGFFESRFFGGQSKFNIATTFQSHDVTFSPFIGAKFTYDINDWSWSAVMATTEATTEQTSGDEQPNLELIPEFIWPNLGSIINDYDFEGTRISYFSLGTLYESGSWNLQAELSYTDAEWAFFPNLAAGYTSIGRSFNDITLFGFASKAKSIKDIYTLSPPPSSSLLIPVIAAIYNVMDSNLKARVVDQETIGIGARYDINTNLALKGQIERTWLKNDRIGGWSTTLSGLNAPVPDHIDTFSISLSFVF